VTEIPHRASSDALGPGRYAPDGGDDWMDLNPEQRRAGGGGTTAPVWCWTGAGTADPECEPPWHRPHPGDIGGPSPGMLLL